VHFELNRSMWCGGASARCDGPNIIKYKPLQRFCHTKKKPVRFRLTRCDPGRIRTRCKLYLDQFHRLLFGLLPIGSTACVCLPLSLSVQPPPPRQHITSRKHLKFAVWENAHQSLQHFLLFSSDALHCCIAL